MFRVFPRRDVGKTAAQTERARWRAWSGRMRKDPRVRAVLLALAVVRIAIGVIAIPLAPFLWERHFVLLVLMRPTKEVLLAAGFLIRLGEVWWVPVLAAAAPLAIFGVWQFYFLGRQYAGQIKSGRMHWIAKRVLRPDHVRTMQSLLRRKGMKLVVLGRLAVFPSSVVALAAGSGDVKSRTFLPADLLGGLLSIVEVMGAGFVLGYAYKRAGPWITVLGFVVLVAIAVVIARALRRERGRSRPTAARARRGARAPSRS
jgi:membrane protein DedA with SNARE-associated domain